jgi:hypothetical protein
VADRTHRPLFYLQAEDLGVNAAVLGANVKRVFEMATEWNAVILLDEADMFMAERDAHDIARNELVSIFLRELEYFRGIIFLTTNLYSTIDSAFRSRVSLHLLFKPLAADAREMVWRKFLQRLLPPKKEDEGDYDREVTEISDAKDRDESVAAYQQQRGSETNTYVENTEKDETKEAKKKDNDPPAQDAGPSSSKPPGNSSSSGANSKAATPTKADARHATAQANPLAQERVQDDEGRKPRPHSHPDLSEEDLKELSAWQLNGREIKNAVKMVKSWCDYKGYPMTLARLENGIRVTSPHATKNSHENDLSLYDE